MKTSRIRLAISFGLMVTAPACSGQFASIGKDSGGASAQGGGNIGNGGSPSVGGNGIVGAGGSTGVTCLYNNVRYLVGNNFPSSDGCNSCSCSPGGLVACTMRACANPGTGGNGSVGLGGSTGVSCQCTGPSPAAPTMQCWDGSSAGPTCVTHSNGTCNWQVTTCPPQPGVGGSTGTGGSTSVTCLYNGVNYLAGKSFKSTDGCNTCTCNSNSHYTCTTLPCPSPGMGGSSGVGGSTGTSCPPIPLIMPVCTNGTAILNHDPTTGCATGYICPTCTAINLPNITCSNYQIVTDPATGCATGYICPIADASVCPAVSLLMPACANATLQHDAAGCATGYVCP